MIMPLGTYMTPNRLNGLAAVFCSAESAGTMLSNSGNASIDPRPRKTVRRGIAFFEMIIAGSFQWSTTEDAEDAEVQSCPSTLFGHPEVRRGVKPTGFFLLSSVMRLSSLSFASRYRIRSRLRRLPTRDSHAERCALDDSRDDR